MSTTQNIQRIIAAALLAASAGLALSSCAGQRQIPEPDRLSDAQVEEQRAAYRDLAERRADMYRDSSQERTLPYFDQAERRAGIGGPVVGDTYRDLAERRLQMSGH